MIIVYILLGVSIILLLGLLIYLFRGPGSSGYYRRGERY